MKSKIVLPFLILVIVLTSSGIAQNVTIDYVSKSLIDTLEISKYSENVQRVLRNNAKGEVYQLQIAKNKSLYTLKGNSARDNERKESTTSDNEGNSSTTITITNKYRESIYKDQEKGLMISNITFAGSEYLIDESLQNANWTIIDENKTIGDFKCKKAIATINGYETEAWFASEIPISNGPSIYSGLPGLVLEIRFGKKVISATKINYNQKEQSINPPTTGEKVTREVYQDIKNGSIKPSSTSKTTTSGNTTTTTTETTTIIKN